MDIITRRSFLKKAGIGAVVLGIAQEAIPDSRLSVNSGRFELPGAPNFSEWLREQAEGSQLEAVYDIKNSALYTKLSRFPRECFTVKLNGKHVGFFERDILASRYEGILPFQGEIHPFFVDEKEERFVTLCDAWQKRYVNSRNLGATLLISSREDARATPIGKFVYRIPFP